MPVVLLQPGLEVRVLLLLQPPVVLQRQGRLLALVLEGVVPHHGRDVADRDLVVAQQAGVFAVLPLRRRE